jgi:hypothetical protein
MFGNEGYVAGFYSWNAFELCRGWGRIMERHPIGSSTTRQRITKGSRERKER